MTEDRTARPLSGEIMAGAPRETERRMGERRIGDRRAEAEVLDADFVTVTPVHADGTARDARRPPTETPGQQTVTGIDILKGTRGERVTHRGGPLFWLFGLCLVLGAFWASGGYALVPRPANGIVDAASQKPAQGVLRIKGVTSRVERQGQRYFLLVDGEVTNEGGAEAVLSGLEIVVAGKDGRTTRYFLGTSDERLKPGGRFAFSSRLEAPKDGVGTVTVDFRKES